MKKDLRPGYEEESFLLEGGIRSITESLNSFFAY